MAQTTLDNMAQSSSSSNEGGAEAASSLHTSLNGSKTSSNGDSSSNNGAGVSGGINPASAGMKAFNALAGYIFGGNSAGSKMAMTTPVFSSTAGTMQFVVPTDPSLVSLLQLQLHWKASAACLVSVLYAVCAASLAAALCGAHCLHRWQVQRRHPGMGRLLWNYVAFGLWHASLCSGFKQPFQG